MGCYWLVDVVDFGCGVNEDGLSLVVIMLGFSLVVLVVWLGCVDVVVYRWYLLVGLDVG